MIPHPAAELLALGASKARFIGLEVARSVKGKVFEFNDDPCRSAYCSAARE